VPVDSVISIYMQEAQLHVKRTHHLLKAAASKYASRYQDGAQLLELCAEADMFPCMFLRRLLEQAVTKIMRDPTVVKDLVRLNGIDSETAQKLLQDLQGDVQQCVDCDQVYSPQADAKRLQLGTQSHYFTGLQYEQKLNRMLADAGIAFWTEEHLRDKGFFKTPDAKLQVTCVLENCWCVPIAVKGRIVNWVDSKATFGDTKSHLEYNQEQFSKYVNRYGPGMVIYWFGFIDDLQGADADLVLVEDFPSAEDTIQLPQLPIPHDIIS
ncbi:MAG: hypothetical protein FRX49_12091, partial [Trebouxia sp. A1-2]